MGITTASTLRILGRIRCLAMGVGSSPNAAWHAGKPAVAAFILQPLPPSTGLPGVLLDGWQGCGPSTPGSGVQNRGSHPFVYLFLGGRGGGSN